MTREQIMSLSDAELVRAVAKSLFPEIMESLGSDGQPCGDFYRKVDCCDWWRPLEDWNACMEVRAAMKEKRFDFELYLCGKGNHDQGKVVFWGNDTMAKLYFPDGDEHRAILRAALLAMGGE